MSASGSIFRRFAALAACALVLIVPAFANTVDNVTGTAANTALDTAGNWSAGLPVSSSDAVFTSGAGYAGSFTLNATSLTLGTLNDLDATALTVTGNKTITFSGGANSVSGASPTDILAGNTLTFTGAGTTIVGGISTSTTGAVVVNNAGGSVTFSGANPYSGGLTLTAGKIYANTSTTSLGSGTLTLNGGTLDFNDSASRGFGRNTTVGGDTTIVSEKNVAGNGVNYTLGTLSIGSQTLNISGGNVNGGTAGVIFTATTLTGNTAFNITNPTGGGTTLLTVAAVANGAYTPLLTGNGNFTATGVWGNGAGGITLGVSGGTVFSGTAL